MLCLQLGWYRADCRIGLSTLFISTSDNCQVCPPSVSSSFVCFHPFYSSCTCTSTHRIACLLRLSEQVRWMATGQCGGLGVRLRLNWGLDGNCDFGWDRRQAIHFIGGQSRHSFRLCTPQPLLPMPVPSIASQPASRPTAPFSFSPRESRLCSL